MVKSKELQKAAARLGLARNVDTSEEEAAAQESMKSRRDAMREKIAAGSPK